MNWNCFLECFQAVIALVEGVFGHHPAVFDPGFAYPNDTATPRTLLNRTDLARQFYLQDYVRIELRQDLDGHTVTLDEFISTLLSTPSDRNRNNLFYLLGQVGAGKTSFINASSGEFVGNWRAQRWG